MNRKKTRALILAAAAALLLLTGCSGGSKTKEISVEPDKLASEIASAAVTSDTLTPAVENMIQGIYYISDEVYQSGAAYMSAGSTACEVVVIECKDASKTADVKKAFEERRTSQETLYESYAPEEAAKLKNAIIKTGGKYAVLVVCDDTAKAEELLKNAGF